MESRESVVLRRGFCFKRERRQEYSPVLTDKAPATWMSCTVMECRCSGASVINWAVVRRLDGHVFVAVEWMGHNAFRVNLI